MSLITNDGTFIRFYIIYAKFNMYRHTQQIYDDNNNISMNLNITQLPLLLNHRGSVVFIFHDARPSAVLFIFILFSVRSFYNQLYTIDTIIPFIHQHRRTVRYECCSHNTYAVVCSLCRRLLRLSAPPPTSFYCSRLMRVYLCSLC